MKISVIMPIYNMEKYVGKAIESWSRQTIDEKELICIDDASTDASREVIENYCNQYSSIQLYSFDENRGSGPARNKGIELAKGEYVCFLDADDFYLDNKSLENLYSHAVANKMNICAGKMQLFEKENYVEFPMFRNELNTCGRNYKRLQYTEYPVDYFYQCFIFKKSFLNQYNIRFLSLRRYQDVPFLVTALFYAEEFDVLNIEMYCHRFAYKINYYSNSVANDLFKGFMYVIEFAVEHHLDKLLDKTIHRLNEEYYGLLIQKLRVDNAELLSLMCKTNDIIRAKGYELKALNYLLYCCTGVDKYDEFETYIKIKSIGELGEQWILYGAGDIGTVLFDIITKSSFAHICTWIDHYKAGTSQMGVILEDIQDICKYQYDKILIAINNNDISDNIKRILINEYGIDDEKIVEWVQIKKTSEGIDQNYVSYGL